MISIAIRSRIAGMKDDKPVSIPHDLDLYPDAQERLERAARAMARRGPIATDMIKRATVKRVTTRRAKAKQGR